jgi:hypothetical protein
MTTPDRVDIPPARAAAEAELLRLWRDLEKWLHRASEPQLSFDDVDVARVLDRWVTLFKEEIDFVRRSRNSVAHAEPLSNDSLDEAVQIGRRLLALLSSKLGH